MYTLKIIRINVLLFLLEFSFSVVKTLEDCNSYNYCPETEAPTWFPMNCVCDDQCPFYADCCKDSQYYSTSDEYQENVEKYSCISLYQYGSVYMKNTCQKNWENDEVISFCENGSPESSRGHHDPVANIPVTSKASNITYANYYCAICNRDATEFRMWDTGWTCEKVGHKQDYTKEHIVENIFFKNNTWGVDTVNNGVQIFSTCTVYPVIPDELQGIVRNCTDMVQSCSSSWEDVTVENMCHSYISAVHNGSIIYRNIHCALCNFVNINETCCYNSGLTTDMNEFINIDFTVILDFPDPSEDVMVGSLSQCNKTEMWDPFFKRCRTIYCSDPNQGLCSDRCVEDRCVDHRKLYATLGNGSIAVSGDTHVHNTTKAVESSAHMINLAPFIGSLNKTELISLEDCHLNETCAEAHSSGWPTRSCKCDDQCHVYGDCCEDSEYYSTSDAYHKNVGKYSCISLYRYGSVYMKNDCPMNWENGHVASLCLRASQQSRIGYDSLINLPVTSKNSNITYTNYYCAVCNRDASDIHIWNTVWVCENAKGDKQNYTKEYVLDKLAFENNTWGVNILSNDTQVFLPCIVHPVIPPALQGSVRKCTDMIQSCANNWKGTSVEEKCHSYNSAVYKDSVVYRNIHCAACNHVNISETYCYNPGNSSQEDMGPKYDFSMLVDISESQCNESESWDTAFSKCRQVFCEKANQVYMWGTCVNDTLTDGTSMELGGLPNTTKTVNSFIDVDNEQKFIEHVNETNEITKEYTTIHRTPFGILSPLLNTSDSQLTINITDKISLDENSEKVRLNYRDKIVVNDNDAQIPINLTVVMDATAVEGFNVSQSYDHDNNDKNSNKVNINASISLEIKDYGIQNVSIERNSFMKSNIATGNKSILKETETSPYHIMLPAVHNTYNMDKDSSNTSDSILIANEVATAEISTVVQVVSADSMSPVSHNANNFYNDSVQSTNNNVMNRSSFATVQDDPLYIPSTIASSLVTSKISVEFLKCHKILLQNGEFTKDDNGTVYVKNYNKLYSPKDYQTVEHGIKICTPVFKEKKFSPLKGWISSVGIGVSCVCLVLHLVAFLIVPAMRNLLGKNLASLCVALLASDITFIVGMYTDDSNLNCTLLAVAKYYLFLSSFCWMNATAFDIWQAFRVAKTKLKVTDGHQWCRFFAYSLYSWLLPAVAVAIVIIIDHAGSQYIPEKYLPRLGKRICWFGNRKALLVFFVLPKTILITLNCIFFVSTARIISEMTLASSWNTIGTQHKAKYKVHMRLAVLMGFTWLTGTLAAYLNMDILWYVFVVLNTFQGAFIFVAFTCRKNVWREFRKYLRRLLPCELCRIVCGTDEQSGSMKKKRLSLTTSTVIHS